MRFGDLVRSSLTSLWQRKFRTSLTVMGVVIGTMAVVVMVSLGVGLSKAQLDSIEQYASLRQITVHATSMMEGEPDADVVAMDDNLVAELESLPGVSDVWPVYFADAEVNLRGTVNWMQLMGVPHSMLESLDVEFASGGVTEVGAPLALVAGDKVGEMYFWDPVTGMPLEVDMATEQFFVTFPGGAGPGEPQPGGGDGEDPVTVAPPQKFLVPVAGVLAGEEMEWGQHSGMLYVDMAALVRTLEEAFPGKALPGQPATPSGKPVGAFVYSQLVLMADDVAAAKELTTSLREQGYQIDAAVEWMDQMEQQSALIQAVFGGIGLISLLVAAIGIANTMLMSVYERTREIGIMKVLGAALRDIRNMFLLESACIGFFGGCFGLLLSLAVSAVLNATLGAMDMGMGAGELSVIPAWLALGAVAFSTLIGTVAGLVPAQRAMRLSALGAIRAQ